MKFLIEENAKIDIKLAISWLSKKLPADEAKKRVIETIHDVKNQLMAHPNSGKKCLFDFENKYREIIKNNYRTIYKVNKSNQETEIIVIVFCHTRMNFQTLLSQSNIYNKKQI